MAKKASNGRSVAENGATIGYEAKLWQMADALRNNMDAAEYKHVVLGLIFLKYISDAFEATRAVLEAQKIQGADPEDPRRVPGTPEPRLSPDALEDAYRKLARTDAPPLLERNRAAHRSGWMASQWNTAARMALSPAHRRGHQSA